MNRKWEAIGWNFEEGEIHGSVLPQQDGYLVRIVKGVRPVEKLHKKTFRTESEAVQAVEAYLDDILDVQAKRLRGQRDKSLSSIAQERRMRR